MSPNPDITLYFLNSSRAIRIAWLLEELNLPYKLVASDRAKNGLGPPEFKAQIPNPMGKSPCIKDGEIVIIESGAIVEYIIENYDPKTQFLPQDPQTRAKVREWVHAAEGTFMLHALAILYARWRLPESARSVLPEMETNMSPNMINDMNWLDGELKAQRAKGSDFIVGKELTAADVMMGFTIEFIMERKLGVKGLGEGRWKEVEDWWGRMREREAYKRAVKKTGYTLEGDFKK